MAASRASIVRAETAIGGKVDIAARYGLPDRVAYCTRCVVSNQRPRIQFDADGVCNACLNAESKNNAVDWVDRESELRGLCDRFRRDDGGFDVVVPSSGGKDSDVVAHKLKYEYDMNPLTVTWAPASYTDIGWRNFQGLVHAGLDNILGTPNGLIHRKLTKLGLLEMGEPFQPFIYGQVAYPMRIAVNFGIPLIMDGENGQVEYGGDPGTGDQSGLTRDEYEQIGFWGHGFDSWVEHGLSSRDLSYYTFPPYEAIERVGVERHFWSYYKKWIPQEHYYYATEHANFRPNPDGRSEGTYSKYASLDDKIDGFHYYFMLLKFGIGRATSDAAHEIRDGHLTRDEGVALVRRYDTEFPEKHFSEALDYMQMTEDEFWEGVEKWRNENLWVRDGNEWQLQHQVS